MATGNASWSAEEFLRTDTEVLVAALRIVGRDLQSADGVANAAVLEGAERLKELRELLAECAPFVLRQLAAQPRHDIVIRLRRALGPVMSN